MTFPVAAAWAGEFGDAYIQRQTLSLASLKAWLSRALHAVTGVQTAI